eukprot:s2802_g2.t1
MAPVTQQSLLADVVRTLVAHEDGLLSLKFNHSFLMYATVHEQESVQSSLPETPVIGIGAGGRVAGQVLVCDDMLGVHGSPPSFAKMFADVGKVSEQAYATYVKEVRSGQFPGDKHSRRMEAAERQQLQKMLPEVQLEPPAEDDG